MDCTPFRADHEVGNQDEVSLANLKIRWNFPQLANDIIFTTIASALYLPSSAPSAKAPDSYHSSLLCPTCKEKSILRIQGLVPLELDASRLKIVELKFFAVHEVLPFHYRRYARSRNTVSSFDSPTIMVECDEKSYPTFPNRLCGVLDHKTVGLVVECSSTSFQLAVQMESELSLARME